MTTDAPSSFSVALTFTGPPEQLLALKATILSIEHDYPGLTMGGSIDPQTSDIEYVGKDNPLKVTVEELLGFGQPNASHGDHVKRVRKALRQGRVETVGQLVEMSEHDLLTTTSLDQAGLSLIKLKLAELDLDFMG